jgi:hypothetical protein
VEWKSKECVDAETSQDGFESGFNYWGNVSGDDGNWETNSAGTPSSSTGPSGASEGSQYAYTETSGSSSGDRFFLQSSGEPCSGASITFDYHMYFNGQGDGTLELQVSTDGGSTWTTEWSQTGDQGNSWNSASVNLGGYAGSSVLIRFSMTTGSGTTYEYDAALDDVVLNGISGAAPPGGFRPDDDWIVDNAEESIYPVKDSFTVGMGPEDNYDNGLHVHIDNGDATGTKIGIGSVEELIDESSQTTINNDFTPALGDSGDHRLGGSSLPWQHVYANAYTTVSDRRTKTQIQESDHGLEEVMELEPVAYKRSDNKFGDTEVPYEKMSTQIGLIAQDVKPVIPEVVSTHHWDLNEEGGHYVRKKNERLGIQYGSLVPVLINAVQEQQDQIQEQEKALKQERQEKEALRQRLRELEERVKALEDE